MIPIMLSDIDPYHQWLSIPPKDQPPDHYRLLGLARFEANVEVIARAAEKRLEYLRTLQTSAEAKECERLRGEMEHARATLLEPHRKAVYDALLRAATLAVTPVSKADHSKTDLLSVGQSLGRFRVLTVDRETRLAVTCTVEDPTAGRVYSLKMLSRQAAADERLRKRFEREVEISQRLSHPNLVTGCEAGAYGKIPYLVSEHVLGTDLQTLVAQCGSFPADQAIELVEQAACGLGQLHLLGVHHRNVSPRNLLLDIQGRVRVTNLLLAGIEEGSELDGDDNLTRTGEAMGSSDFMAPEQVVDASAADQRADIYSLGCTLFYLLTGRVPYGGRGAMEKALAHRNNPIPSLEDNCPAAPAWLDRVFEKMVAKQPEDRYQSMAEVSRALLAGRSSRGSRLTPMLLGGVGLAVVFAAVLAMAIAGWLGGSAKTTVKATPARETREVVQPAADETPARGDEASGMAIPPATMMRAEDRTERPLPSPDVVVKPVPPKASASQKPMPQMAATPQVAGETEAKPIGQPNATSPAAATADPARNGQTGVLPDSERPTSSAGMARSESQPPPAAPSETLKPPSKEAPAADDDSSDSWVPPLVVSEDAKKRRWPYVGPVPNRIVDESKATYFVSLDGNDDNDGRTRKTAFATMQHAADVVQPGETVLVTKGVYHAGFQIAKQGTPNAWLTFQAEPGVEIRGTEVRRDWQRELGELPIYSAKWSSPGHQVCSEGRLLQEVNEYAALRPRGTFFVDRSKKRFFVCLASGKNPNEAATETSVTDMVWAIKVGPNLEEQPSDGVKPQSSYIRVDGFAVRNVSTPWSGIVVTGPVDHVIVENCDVQWAIRVGIGGGCQWEWNKQQKKWFFYECRHVLIRNCIASNNGCLGIAGGGADYRIESNVIDNNNYRDFSPNYECGAVKCIGDGLHHVQIRGNVARHNNGDGLWFDYGGDGNVIEDNLVVGDGIHNEVTPPPEREKLDNGELQRKILSIEEVKRWKPVGTTIRRNIVAGARNHGVTIVNSCNAKIYNNIFYANGLAGIEFGGAYDRPDTNGESGNRAWGNICEANLRHAHSLPDNVSARFFDNVIGPNLYGSFRAKLPFLAGRELSPEQWQQVHPTARQDLHINGELFRNPERFDFTLKVAKQATKIGFDVKNMRLDWSEFLVPVAPRDPTPEWRRLAKTRTRGKTTGDCVFRANFNYDVSAIYSDGVEVAGDGINPYAFDGGKFVPGIGGTAIVPEKPLKFPVPEDFPAMGQGAILLRLNADDWRTPERKAEKDKVGWHRRMQPLTVSAQKSPWMIRFQIDKGDLESLSLLVQTSAYPDQVDVTKRITPGRWFQVLVNWHPDPRNPRATLRRVYIDGQPIAEKRFPGVPGVVGGPMYLGVPPEKDAAWIGAMDQVRIYRRAFTDQEIQQLVTDLDGSDKAPTRRSR